MEYLLKVNAIIVIFYLCYKVLLQRDTFFEQNRWFLLLGLVTAFTLPLFVIPIYVEYTPTAQPNYNSLNNVPILTDVTDKPFNALDYLPYIYGLGVFFFFIRFIIQFASLGLVILKNKSEKKGDYTFIKTVTNISPFSFFNWIVYNPDTFSKMELDQILTHEKVHANQYHSIDILFTQLSCIVLWFNPFIWFYNKNVKQNLEFIADHEAQQKFNCKKSYQTTLLKSSMPSHQMALSNNFYNSLIKKRIIMLHKSKSKKINLLKYIFIIPLLTLFLMSFNTSEVYIQTKTQNSLSQSINKHEQGTNAENYEIHNHFTDEDFIAFSNKLKSNGFNFNLKEIERNSDDYISSIYFTISKNEAVGNYRIAAGISIETILIQYFKKENKFIINTLGFKESLKNYNDKETIKVVIDNNTTPENFESQKKRLKEKYDIDSNFSVLDKNEKGEIKTYSFSIGRGKMTQKITTSADRSMVFSYSPKTNSISHYGINKNGDPEYGRTYNLDARRSHILLNHYTSKSLKDYETRLKKENITVTFSGVKRNTTGEIISIKISAKSKHGSKISYSSPNTGKPIKPIAISYYGDGNNVEIAPPQFIPSKQKNSINKENKN